MKLTTVFLCAHSHYWPDEVFHKYSQYRQTAENSGKISSFHLDSIVLRLRIISKRDIDSFLIFSIKHCAWYWKDLNDVVLIIYLYCSFNRVSRFREKNNDLSNQWSDRLFFNTIFARIGTNLWIVFLQHNFKTQCAFPFLNQWQGNDRILLAVAVFVG